MAKKKNYPGHIARRGPSFRVTLCVDGEYHKYTVRAAQLANDFPEEETPEERAEAFARKKFGELRRRSGMGLPGPMPVSGLLERYRKKKLPSLAANTRRTYSYSLDAAESFFVEKGGDPTTHAIRPGHIEGFMEWRRDHSPDGSKRRKPLAARSVAKDRAVLHAVFEYGETLEIVEANPVSKTDPPKGDGRDPIILSESEYNLLLDHCKREKSDPMGPMLRFYVLTLGETGVRCDSEALWLRWQDVDVESGFVTVETVRKGRRTKSGKSRKVPMTPRLRKAYREHMAAFRMQTYGTPAKRSPWVFHHPVARRRAKAGERIGSLRRGFEAAVQRARESLEHPEDSKLSEELNQHDLRHRRVTTWLAEGKPAHLVQKAMGHADLRTTMGYAHLVAEDLRQLVEPEEELRRLAK